MNIYSIREAAEYLLDHIDKMGYAINKLDKKIEELEKEIEDLKGMSKHDELYCKNCGCKEVQVDAKRCRWMKYALIAGKHKDIFNKGGVKWEQQ